MKLNKQLIINFILLIVVASIYRVLPRPFGFAPQIAMALFAGVVVKDKRWAFAFPLLSMFLSDLFYQVLYINGLTSIEGFYGGQVENYLMITALTAIGFLINTNKIPSYVAGFFAAPTAYFLISNFAVWIGGGGYQRPKTLEGLMMCYADGIPFYQMSILSTFVFGAILFGAHKLIVKRVSLA